MRREVETERVRAGDVLILGDQFGPLPKTVKVKSVTESWVYVTFADGAHVRLPRHKTVQVERRERVGA